MDWDLLTTDRPKPHLASVERFYFLQLHPEPEELVSPVGEGPGGIDSMCITRLVSNERSRTQVGHRGGTDRIRMHRQDEFLFHLSFHGHYLSAEELRWDCWQQGIRTAPVADALRCQLLARRDARRFGADQYLRESTAAEGHCDPACGAIVAAAVVVGGGGDDDVRFAPARLATVPAINAPAATLPTDLLLHIFAQLPWRRRSDVRRVCRWWDLAFRELHHLRVDAYRPLPLLPVALRPYTQLRRLTLVAPLSASGGTELDATLGDALREAAPQLVELHLVRCTLPAAAVRAVRRCLPHLRRLGLVQCTAPGSAPGTSVVPTAQDAADSAADPLPPLDSLLVAESTIELYQPTLAAPLRRWWDLSLLLSGPLPPCLCDLTVAGLARLRAPHLDDLSRMRHLQVLRLRDAVVLPISLRAKTSILAQVAAAAPPLRVLWVGSALATQHSAVAGTAGSDADVAAVVRACPQLEELVLSHQTVSGAMLESVAACARLRLLYVDSLNGVSGAQLAALASCLSLQCVELSVRGGPQLPAALADSDDSASDSADERGRRLPPAPPPPSSSTFALGSSVDADPVPLPKGRRGATQLRSSRSRPSELFASAVPFAGPAAAAAASTASVAAAVDALPAPARDVSPLADRMGCVSIRSVASSTRSVSPTPDAAMAPGSLQRQPSPPFAKGSAPSGFALIPLHFSERASPTAHAAPVPAFSFSSSVPPSPFSAGTAPAAAAAGTAAVLSPFGLTATVPAPALVLATAQPSSAQAVTSVPLLFSNPEHVAAPALAPAAAAAPAPAPMPALGFACAWTPSASPAPAAPATLMHAHPPDGAADDAGSSPGVCRELDDGLLAWAPHPRLLRLSLCGLRFSAAALKQFRRAVRADVRVQVPHTYFDVTGYETGARWMSRYRSFFEGDLTRWKEDWDAEWKAGI